jgi:cold shock CspA family protein
LPTWTNTATSPILPPIPRGKRKIKAEHIEISVPKKEDWDEPSAFRGRVEFFNDEKGFGFIKSLDSHDKFFFHVSGLIDEVQENDIVNYELERGQRGMNAVRVVIEKKE